MEMRWKQVCSAVRKIDTSAQPKHGDEVEASVKPEVECAQVHHPHLLCLCARKIRDRIKP
eukprot:1152733-Pelagomonas_calceolata.AAC.4